MMNFTEINELVHDLVDTSKMQATYNGALIHVTGRASADLDNGRLAILNPATEAVSYAAKTSTRVYLVASVEKMYENHLGRTYFYNKSGKPVRLMAVELDDEFSTTNNGVTFDKGTELQIGAEGTLEAFVDGVVKFVVVDKVVMGDFYGIEVKRIA